MAVATHVYLAIANCTRCRYNSAMVVIYFPVPITPNQYRTLMAKGPVWITAEGELYPVATLHDSHLSNIERWLRGGGSTPGPLELAPEDILPFRVVASLEGIEFIEEWQLRWLSRLQHEMKSRGLAKLPDHPASMERRHEKAPVSQRAITTTTTPARPSPAHHGKWLTESA